MLGCPGWYAYLPLLPEAFFFLFGCPPCLGCVGHVWLPCLNWLVPSSCKLPQGYLVLALSWAITAIAAHFACFQMPTLLFGRHAAIEFLSGFNFVTSAFPGCFAGMLLGLKELLVLPLIFLVSCSML
jgi:hypothetical protein